MSRLPILSTSIAFEQDVVLARQHARQLAGALGFDAQDRTRFATSVSEVARNAFRYAGGGRVEFFVGGEPRAQFLGVRLRDSGPGIPHLDVVLAGAYRSQTGLGMGILGAKRLSDVFEIVAPPGGGTDVTVGKLLPKGSPEVTASRIAQIGAELAGSRVPSPLEEAQQQNHELLRVLDELRERQVELARLNEELEDTNRGVVALYGELDEKAESLRRASEIKTRFLSNMSHEFRTPLNAVRSLTGILLAREDGELTEEQEKQIGFIRRSALELSELVDDLLDIAKVEAGKVNVRVATFTASDLLGALRGMMRPLASERPEVELVIDEPVGVPPMRTDEGKLSQILRNLASNALKFTERGEVRVRAAAVGDGMVAFTVSDTGIGIPVEHQARIFEEFEQVESRVQIGLKGTGLGLPLSRKLTELLGGTLEVHSVPGRGSSFTATIPANLGASVTPEDEPVESVAYESAGTILVVDDDDAARRETHALLVDMRYTVADAGDGAEGLRLARETAPRAVLLDLSMPKMSGEEVLTALRSDAGTAGLPVVVYSSSDLGAEELDRLRLAGAVFVRKGSMSPGDASVALRDALESLGVRAGGGV